MRLSNLSLSLSCSLSFCCSFYFFVKFALRVHKYWLVDWLAAWWLVMKLNGMTLSNTMVQTEHTLAHRCNKFPNKLDRRKFLVEFQFWMKISVILCFWNGQSCQQNDVFFPQEKKRTQNTAFVATKGCTFSNSLYCCQNVYAVYTMQPPLRWQLGKCIFRQINSDKFDENWWEQSFWLCKLSLQYAIYLIKTKTKNKIISDKRLLLGNCSENTLSCSLLCIS